MVLQLYLYGFSVTYLGNSLLFTRLSHLADLKPPISTKPPQKLAEKKDCGVLQDLRSMPNINQSMSFFQARDRLDGSSKWHKSTCSSIEIHIVVRVNSSVKLIIQKSLSFECYWTWSDCTSVAFIRLLYYRSSDARWDLSLGGGQLSRRRKFIRIDEPPVKIRLFLIGMFPLSLRQEIHDEIQPNPDFFEVQYSRT